jgi:putative Holliday junction resolvase
MGIVTLEDFKILIPHDCRLLGLDVGTKTIGVAFGALPAGISTPLKVIQRKKMAVDSVQLTEFMSEYGCAGLVVGWPLNTDGTVGSRCQGVRDVMLELLKLIPDVPVTFYDERFSTRKAQDFMIGAADASRVKRGRVVDKMAARSFFRIF